MIFDGDCGFCKKWITRWRSLTGERVDYAPYQDTASRIPQISPELFQKSVYLVEPEIVSKSFRLSRTPLDYRAECVTGYEGREPGDSVPHYAPDQNPFADEFVKLYHLPREAVLGYRETLYPEYRKKIKDTYVPPPPCTESCGVAGNFVLRR